MSEERANLMHRLAREIADMGQTIIPPKVFIYMNHFIKEKKVSDPVITVQYEGNKDVVYANTVELLDEQGRVMARVKFDPAGLSGAPFHHVRAWVETRLKVRIK
jgi:hypothetical protein